MKETIQFKGTELIVDYDYVAAFSGSQFDPPHSDSVEINEIKLGDSKVDLIELLEDYLGDIEIAIFETRSDWMGMQP